MEGTPPVYQIPTPSSVKRSKFLWRGIVIGNFALAAYIFSQPSKKERQREQNEVPAETAPIPEKAAPFPAEAAPIPTKAAPLSVEIAPVAAAEPAPIRAEAPPFAVQEEPILSPPIPKPVIVRQPVPEDQQRELFKWMLEEKKKVKPHNQEEKKRIDEDKDILEEFIRSNYVPPII